ADSTVPADANSVSRSDPVVEKVRFPTNSFLPMFSPAPTGAHAIFAVSEREAEFVESVEEDGAGSRKQNETRLIRLSLRRRNRETTSPIAQGGSAGGALRLDAAHGLLRCAGPRVVQHQEGGACHHDNRLAPWAPGLHRTAADALEIGERRLAV